MVVPNTRHAIAILAIMSGLGRPVAAQAVTQTLSFQVDAINQIAFTGSPSLVINTAVAGGNPSSATVAVTWAVTTNQSNAKITASLNAALPADVTLTVDLTAPAGAASAGAQSLGTTSVDLVTGMTQVAQSALGVTYTLSATAAAGVVPSTTRTVTYTITGGT
jgi:hypothetical protein